MPYGDLGDTHRFSISFQSLEDSDKDGIHDGIDRCPNTPVGATVDSRGCPLDSDKDGVYDGLDQCPDTPEGAKVDAKGCPIDSDKDGVYDGLDQCPDTPERATVDARGCPIDSDKDGVYDGLDQCPDTPEGAKVDDKGCPIDSDNDGVYDGLDQCPDTPEGAKVDAKGCPVVEAGEQWTLKELSFEHNKATLIPQSYAGLNEAAKILEQHMEVKIEIEGHSDNSGTPECNRKISQQRAEAVMEYLVSKGITAERMKAIGYGALRPVADNDTEEGQAKNRRVEFKILEKE